MSGITHTLENGFCTMCGESAYWLDRQGERYTQETADKDVYSVTDPAGVTHTKTKGKRVYTHALIRQNRADGDPSHYYVNWATSEANAQKEARVLKDQRSYIAIVALH